MRVLVLGAYGLIGGAITRELLARGMTVTGLARSAARGRALHPGARWIGHDLRALTTPESWTGCLEDIDAVVNASGALQSGGGDDLGTVQRDAICALIAAAEQSGVARFVQISAPGAAPGAATEFLRTKGAADRALMESGLAWTILRPGLVLSSTAYGGSSLLRLLAAFPVIQPLVLAQARVQTVSVEDVAAAVARCLADATLANRSFDLVEPQDHSLMETVLAVRRWLGFTPPRKVLVLPRAFGNAVAFGADIAGRLGWRPPLRTTALRVLADNVLGDPEPWAQATGERLGSLEQTLRTLPSTRQERVFARTRLLFPVLVVAFALFWIASGAIGFARHEAAVAVVSDTLGRPLASAFVHAGSAFDVLVGIGLLAHRSFRAASMAAIALSLGYLAAGSVVTPDLWADPLGPFVKVVPVIALASALWTMAEDR